MYISMVLLPGPIRRYVICNTTQLYVFVVFKTDMYM